MMAHQGPSESPIEPISATDSPGRLGRNSQFWHDMRRRSSVAGLTRTPHEDHATPLTCMCKMAQAQSTGPTVPVAGNGGEGLCESGVVSAAYVGRRPAGTSSCHKEPRITLQNTRPVAQVWNSAGVLCTSWA